MNDIGGIIGVIIMSAVIFVIFWYLFGPNSKEK